MNSFRHLKSVIRLGELAEDPLDFSKEGALTARRIDNMCAEALGMKLLYGAERVTDVTLQALIELAEETQALKKMEGMQAGEIVNFIEGHPSEQRPALHTAMRDFFENPNPSPKAKDAAQLAYQELEKLKNFLLKIQPLSLPLPDLPLWKIRWKMLFLQSISLLP